LKLKRRDVRREKRTKGVTLLIGVR